MEQTSFSYSGTELSAMGEARNYYGWLSSLIVPYVGERAIEVGAGIGTLSAELLRRTQVTQLTLVEPAQNLFGHLKRRFADDSRVTTISGYLNDCTGLGQFDSFISVNVLEHVEDDSEFLHLAAGMLTSGGRLILFVPALAPLYGTLDKEFGHFRRYGKRDLLAKLRLAGFCIDIVKYVNSLGTLSWFLASRVMRRRTLRNADVRFYDTWIVPWLSKLERRWKPPFGQNLIAISRKP